MIPLSNGRSPRIDQFYATLRTFKSHRFQQESYELSEEDKSIQIIRSVGKQILADISTHKKKHNTRANPNHMFKSQQLLLKPRNLYDKYETKVDKKIVKVINNAKQNLIKQQIDKIPQKIKKDKKFQQVSSKFEEKNMLKGLNYAKKADNIAQKLKVNKIQTEKLQRQIKQKQIYYQKNTKLFKNTDKNLVEIGLIKRTQQLQVRKIKCIEKIRTQQLQQEMKGVTFQPQLISKRVNTSEYSFQKRNSIAKLKKLSNQKDIIKQVIGGYTFHPLTNRYKDSQSKIAGQWKQGKGNKANFSQTLRIEDLDFGQKQFKSQQTANSTTRINLKSLNQISFIFQ